jgi:hypothetical protein
MGPKVKAKARGVIAAYYREHGVVPTLVEFTRLMEYNSEASGHAVVSQLVADGFLAQEQFGRRRYISGPLFVTSPGKTGVPAELMDALPSGDNLHALRVDEHWRPCTEVGLKQGDLVVVAVGGQATPDSLNVFRRGKTYEIRHDFRRGWTSEGVFLGMYRTHAHAPQFFTPTQSPESVAEKRLRRRKR